MQIVCNGNKQDKVELICYSIYDSKGEKNKTKVQQ